MSVRSRTKGKEPPRPRRQNRAARMELTPEMIYLFQMERAKEEEENPHAQRIYTIRQEREESRKIRKEYHPKSTTTWGIKPWRKSYAH